ncbi:MAG: glycoside hydrolase family 43, partial [Ruminococcus sp.]|nr:glycoside hydrolase family 43 [Ruminococcus sp.]
SVCAALLDSDLASQKIMLSLQYKDSSGTTQYGHIADATAVKGNYVQLANTNYKIPSGASDLYLYVETESGTDNFYIDEAIVAVKGTKINGPAEIKFTLGDINSDGVIDSFDLVLLRRGLINGFKNTAAALAADVNQDSKNDIADAVVFQKYLLRQIANFNQGSSSSSGGDEPTETMSMEAFTKLISANIRETETSDSRLEKSGVQYGTIKNGTYYSTTCNRNKPYYILLPANYDESKKYPVLYVMHGYWENERRMILDGNNGNAMCTRQIIGNAIAEGEAKDMIVVFPYIYSSATQASCSAMDDANNAAYDNFINDLTKDLMPHIEKTYSVKTGKNNTAITGFSMGGRESLLIGMKLSDKIGYIGAICPAPGVTGSFKWDSGKEPYLVFITAGSNDQTVYTVPNGYHESFTKNGVPHIWHYVNGGAHGDNSIHPHLYNFVRAVFKAA